MESSKHGWTLSGTATSLHFFLKILFLVPKVSNSWIFQRRCFIKIIWHWITIQTLLYQTCLPTRQNGVENRDKAYKRPPHPLATKSISILAQCEVERSSVVTEFVPKLVLDMVVKELFYCLRLVHVSFCTVLSCWSKINLLSLIFL